jgi:hypothetical protein
MDVGDIQAGLEASIAFGEDAESAIRAYHCELNERPPTAMRKAGRILDRLLVPPDIALQGRLKSEYETLLRDLRDERTPATRIVVRALNSALPELTGTDPADLYSLSKVLHALRGSRRKDALEQLHKAARRAQLPAVRRPINYAANRLALRLTISCRRHRVPLLTDNGAFDINSALMVALREALPRNSGVGKLARWALRKVGC